MKRLIACLLLLCGAGAACADELGDAAQALNRKDYPRALATYTRLAQAGNPEATLRLGEMYWYGEGVVLDRAQGDALFAKAAASGSQAALAATGLSAQRAQQLPAIAYWTSTYDGADLTAGPFHCVAPEQPTVSRNKGSVAAANVRNNAYVACYNGFIDNLLSAVPPGSRIPADLVLLMSEQELVQAREHIGKVYAAVAAQEKRVSEQVLANRAAWVDATLAFLQTEAIREDKFMQDERMFARESKDATYANKRSGGLPNRAPTSAVGH